MWLASDREAKERRPAEAGYRVASLGSAIPKSHPIILPVAQPEKQAGPGWGMQPSYNKTYRTMRSNCARCPQLPSPSVDASSSALVVLR